MFVEVVVPAWTDEMYPMHPHPVTEYSAVLRRR